MSETNKNWEYAEINGITVQCESVDDSFGKAVIRKEIPGQDYTILQNMGRTARTVNVRAVFYGEQYPAHEALLALLSDTNILELKHPQYGVIRGDIENINVRHDDRLHYAEIDISFVAGVRSAEPTIAGDVKGTAQGAYETGITQAKDSFASQARELLGQEAGDILTRVVDHDAGILTQITGVTGPAREYVKKVDRFVSAVEAKINHIATPANVLSSTLEFSADIPGRVMKSIANLAARYTKMFESSRTAPHRFIQSFADGVAAAEEALELDADDETDISLRRAYRTITALEGGVQMGALFSEDEEARNRQRALEKIRSFDAAGNYVNQWDAEAVMNVNEIEQALYTAREMIQDAAEDSRENRDLNDMALALSPFPYMTSVPTLINGTFEISSVASCVRV